MTVWEKTLINVQKGYTKLTTFAATFSDRVKTEITIIRLKIQINGIEAKVREQQQFIGRKLLQLKANNELPRTFELFFQSDEISRALEKIERLTSDLEILLDDLQRETEDLKPTPPTQEERSA